MNAIADQLGSALRHLRGVIARLEEENDVVVGHWMSRLGDAHPDMWKRMFQDDMALHRIWRELKAARRAVASGDAREGEVDLDRAIAEVHAASESASALLGEERRLTRAIAETRQWWLGQMSKLDPERWLARRARSEKIERARRELAAVEALLKEEDR